MKTSVHRWRRRARGMTLMELTLTLTMTLAIAYTMVGLLSQQVTFMQIIRSFSFLRDEAPAVNLMVGRIMNQTDLYRIYGSRADAFAGTGAVNSGGAAVWLRFRNPDGTFDQSVIAFEPGAGGPRLNYYHRPPGGPWPDAPNWVISSRVAGAVFADDSGVLELALTGPAGERITYAATLE